MNEFEDLLRFLDTGLNREAPLLHPLTLRRQSYRHPRRFFTPMSNHSERGVAADCGPFVGYRSC
jgi:hypothetical protein